MPQATMFPNYQKPETLLKATMFPTHQKPETLLKATMFPNYQKPETKSSPLINFFTRYFRMTVNMQNSTSKMSVISSFHHQCISIRGKEYSVVRNIYDNLAFVAYEVMDGAKRMSISYYPDEAIKQARIAVLSSLDYSDLTYNEFVEIALVVPVKEGCGVNGNAKAGKSRYLIDDYMDWHEMIGAIRKEGDRIYRAEHTEIGISDIATEQQKKWLSEFIGAVLHFHGSVDVTTTGVRGTSRPFVLVNTQSRAAGLSRDAVLKLAYDTEQAEQDDRSIIQGDGQPTRQGEKISRPRG